jgi:hypothetical protein
MFGHSVRFMLHELGIMDDENIYERIQDIFGHFPGKLSILEEQIDIDLQMEYFEFSRNFKNNSLSGNIHSVRNKLYDQRHSIASKKKLLVHLACIEEVEAYRTIEKYLEKPDKGLRDWAVLAFQESRMLLLSKLLDENQVFISTGLGGKGSKLRYFIVLINSFDKPFTGFQQNLIRNEFDFFLRRNDSELEQVNFIDSYCSLLAIVPINASIRDIFKTAVTECNEYGGFIKPNFIVTNVKKLSIEEIRDFINNQDESGKFEID